LKVPYPGVNLAGVLTRNIGDVVLDDGSQGSSITDGGDPFGELRVPHCIVD
jgi:hypothetical protein